MTIAAQPHVLSPEQLLAITAPHRLEAATSWLAQSLAVASASNGLWLGRFSPSDASGWDVVHFVSTHQAAATVRQQLAELTAREPLYEDERRRMQIYVSSLLDDPRDDLGTLLDLLEDAIAYLPGGGMLILDSIEGLTNSTTTTRAVLNLLRDLARCRQCAIALTGRAGPWTDGCDSRAIARPDNHCGDLHVRVETRPGKRYVAKFRPPPIGNRFSTT